MAIDRRDVLLSLAGGVAGALFTPVPWTLLDDIAIRTQHRRALKVPASGEVRQHAVACTLCPAGCALSARSIEGRPVFLGVDAADPLGAGACPFGLAQHQLPHHPLRLATPARMGPDQRPTRIALGAAVSAIATAIRSVAEAGRGVLVLDARPGRVVSRAYRELLAALPLGLYATPGGEAATLQALAAPGAGLLGIDLERTRMLLSFGAPVLEGWGRPGRMLAVRSGLRVVQLDTWRSPSAALADEWIAIRPGSEAAMALALAHVAVEAGWVPRPSQEVHDRIRAFDPARVATLTGVDAWRIEELARSLITHAPAVAIGGGDPGGGPLPPDVERAIALLDVVLGSVGRSGGIVARREVPDAEGAAAVPESALGAVRERSVGLLLLDAADSGRALPWTAIGRTLAPKALVVSLSPFLTAFARQAHLLVPAPAPLESHAEILPTADASVASYRLSVPLVTPPPGATDPVALLERVAMAAGLTLAGPWTTRERLERRVAAIQSARRGRLLVSGDSGYREEPMGDAASVWKALVAGGCWLDDAAPAACEVTAPLPSAESAARWLHPARADGLALVATAARGAAGSLPAAPILSKLYQETDLRPSVSTAGLNPATARARGLVDGQEIRVESAVGSVCARVLCDATLPADRVTLAAGPDPDAMQGREHRPPKGALALAVVEPDLTWRQTCVTIREA